MNTLAHQLHISSNSLRQFVQDFNLNIEDIIDEKLNLSDDFLLFAKENSEFLKQYDEDLKQEKSIEDISNKISEPQEKIQNYLKEEHPNLFDTDGFKTSISSFGIHQKLGGDYQFIYNYFGKQTPLTQHDFIGYRDLFFHITDLIEPFLNPKQLENWGIEKPAGIIIYGPPGSGKVFWAKKIAEIIGYKFTEVKNQLLSIMYDNGETSRFKDFLCSNRVKSPHTIIFLENFAKIATEENPERPLNLALLELKNLILQTIHHNINDKILFMGATNSLQGLDIEILAPGRFDLCIPVFPPNVEERAEMILANLLHHLTEKSPLLQVLKNNNADKIPFWKKTAQNMKLFSNTMVIDFTQAIKKRIHAEYMRLDGKNVIISEKIISAALNEAFAKLTPEYLEYCASFINELAQNNSMEFPRRIQNMLSELEFYKIKDKPVRKIGFNAEEEEENKNEEV
ncbi:ATP-binding protein [Elizabethkingia sp. JS20170427COW]|uniref:AAA family ATPase n=1 Tax=Elizabethkingia sp. JS20170427COW TaxID=2583851 RepID=UPI0011105240|nr:ATP-binding protein [Elizabethkingia sp. JS20170427COW]QCX52850.1 ATP-binding protein [Elizabethkingia sp. JS20170427COW]